MASIGPAERLLIKELLAAMYEYDGAGLAAPQVGLEEQIFVGDSGQGPFVVINPRILKTSSRKTVLEEGCLSFPGIRIRIDRPETIRVSYQNELGQMIERDVSGLEATVFQHEIDHLNGRMIIDYASPQELKMFKTQLRALEDLSSCPAARRKPRV